MSLTVEEIKKIARLAALDLSADDITRYIPELTQILHFIDTIDGIDTSHLTPLSHPLELTQRLRPDLVTETNQRDQFQQIAPAVEAGLYLVPKVIEES
ncbi:MAG: asparaginyl/glutamyl-tRNA amidotransferase subunit C [Gammaproteobacteria bacterium RIFCSPHIGHO2_12_FULL_42_10]|nr:MAG: asparaginyl/glutamyl-tRNA amidotransferase subunit C [Gammaproteobacteria bacterium RIFCSPHIGHO2_12_FULL_42_10]